MLELFIGSGPVRCVYLTDPAEAVERIVLWWDTAYPMASSSGSSSPGCWSLRERPASGSPGGWCAVDGDHGGVRCGAGSGGGSTSGRSWLTG